MRLTLAVLDFVITSHDDPLIVAYIILLAEKFLESDWLRREVFQPNLIPTCKNYSCRGNRRDGFVLLLKQWRIAFLELTTVKYNN